MSILGEEQFSKYSNPYIHLSQYIFAVILVRNVCHSQHCFGCIVLAYPKTQAN